MATRSASSMRADNLDFSRRSSGWPARPGWPVPQPTPQERERAERQKTLLDALAAAACVLRAAAVVAGRPRARRDYLARPRPRRRDHPRVSGWASRRTAAHALRRALGRRVPGGAAARGRAAAPARRRRRALRLFPRPGHVPDRRPRAAGSSPSAAASSATAAEIPQLAGHAALPQGPGALRLGGGARQCWPRDDAAPGGIVTEGYMDVIALHRAGFPARWRRSARR